MRQSRAIASPDAAGIAVPVNVTVVGPTAIQIGGALCLVALLAIWTVTTSAGVVGTSDFVIAVAVSCAAFYAVLLLISARRVGWAHPIPWVCTLGLLSLVRRFDVITNGMLFHEALPGRESGELNQLLAQRLVLEAVGVACFSLAVGTAITRSRVGRSNALRNADTTAIVRVFAGASVVAVAYLFYRGGAASVLEEQTSTRRDALAGQFYFFVPAYLAACSALLYVAAARSMASLLRGIAMVGCGVVIVFLTNGSRADPVQLLTALFLIFVLRSRKVQISLMAGLAASAIVSFSVLTNAQAGSVRLPSTEELVTAVSARGEISSRSSTADGPTAILGKVPMEVDYLWGSSYLAAASSPVPRAVWPDKPGLIDGEVGRRLFGGSTGVPASAVGEAYWNFGLVGVPLVFFLFGLLWRTIWRSIATSSLSREGFFVLVSIALVYASAPATTQLVSALPVFAALAIAVFLGQTPSSTPSLGRSRWRR